ncbi:low molecular weight phosphatase family protein [Streptomyces erythrochromogenes]|uniref:hypothetical protein n=1 Tax=Streptomyces erythrochromogenes TaxID=285574 RepID=UPI0036A216D8
MRAGPQGRHSGSGGEGGKQCEQGGVAAERSSQDCAGEGSEGSGRQAELSIEISDQKPKVLTPEAAQVSHCIIVMDCGDTCPYFPGKTYLDWQLEEPCGQGVAAVRPSTTRSRASSRA